MDNEVFGGMTCRCGFETIDEDEAERHKCSDVKTDEQIIEELCPELAEIKKYILTELSCKHPIETLMMKVERIEELFIDLWREKERLSRYEPIGYAACDRNNNFLPGIASISFEGTCNKYNDSFYSKLKSLQGGLKEGKLKIVKIFKEAPDAGSETV
jgi:hypothetical protein